MGTVRGEIVELSQFGEIVRRCWQNLAEHFSYVELDAFVIMPNHAHDIIVIDNAGNPTAEGAKVGAKVGAKQAPYLLRPRVSRHILINNTENQGEAFKNDVDASQNQGEAFSNGENASPLRVHERVMPHGTQAGSIGGAILQNFKSVTTRKINQFRGVAGVPVWQRNYHERIIRNERELHGIREYIVNNPRQWALDRENPANIDHT